jgi:hypothetical protein
MAGTSPAMTIKKLGAQRAMGFALLNPFYNWRR